MRRSALSLVFIALALALPPAASGRSSLESVALERPGDYGRLVALGLDVTEDVRPAAAVVAFHSRGERERADAAGFERHVLVADLEARSRSDRRGELLSARALSGSRTTYRAYEDYLSELRALASPQNAGFVRRFTIGRSVEGREIVGVEVAAGVRRRDDGRPAYVQMGLHHAREWPSGEYVIEFARDLVRLFKAGDARVTALLQNTRVYLLPVINPDGFAASRGAAPSAASPPYIRGTISESRRKNCRPAGDGAVPCSLRPLSSGVDLNRNYGYYWGGWGAAAAATASTYRGPAPFSEPESQAVNDFTSSIHPTVLITNHTMTPGYWLRLPGFFDPQIVPTGSLPDETAMKSLGDAMAAATGWTSAKSTVLGSITGATEDWNYFAQGTYGYTPEARGTTFHGPFGSMVISEYEGDASHPGEGVREAFLRAGEVAADPAEHGVISGPAPAGATLTLEREFNAPACGGGSNANACEPQVPGLDERVETTLAVPASGAYSWHVGPSSRPLHLGEQWTMRCRRPGSGAEFTKAVTVGRGAVVNVDWVAGGACGAPPGGANAAPSADFTVIPAARERGAAIAFVSASADADGAIDPAATAWDLDDDGHYDDATGLVATRSFGSVGLKRVRMRVTDDDGASSARSRTIRILAAAPNEAPKAAFRVWPSAPRIGGAIMFESRSVDGDGAVVRHAWDLDDDGRFDDGTGAGISRIFTRGGNHLIRLRVSDDDGAARVTHRNVYVGTPPATRCLGRRPTIYGSPGPDRILGSPGRDVIATIGGADRILGGGGPDLICGQGGRDVIVGGPGNDRILGNKGRDRLFGKRGADRISGGAGADSIFGGPGRDRCSGGSGRDRLIGC